jgi:hypothetical protein
MIERGGRVRGEFVPDDRRKSIGLRYLDDWVFTLNLCDRTDYGRFDVVSRPSRPSADYAEVTGQR